MDSLPEPPEGDAALPSPLFWPCESESRDPPRLTGLLTYRNKRDNKFGIFEAALFVVIYYGSNRKMNTELLKSSVSGEAGV